MNFHFNLSSRISPIRIRIFLHETISCTTSLDATTTDATPVSYGSSTFMEESDDDTDTEADISHTDRSDSVSTSQVFSSQTASDTYREWKDVTEIVKE